MIVIEIGKKAPKVRRLPQRSRERLPPRPKDSTVWRQLCRRDLDSSIEWKAHEDVTGHASKHVDTQVRGGCITQAGLRKIYERLSADERKSFQKMITSQLGAMVKELLALDSPSRNASWQHGSCAQARYVKPSVKTRVSKLEKGTRNEQKQERRRRQKQVGIPHKKLCCLPRAFRDLGIKVPYAQDGPFWVLRDGSEMLRPHGYIIKPVNRIVSNTIGKWVVCRNHHCTALRRYGDNDTWSIDGAVREHVAEKEVDNLIRDAQIFQVPCRRSHEGEGKSERETEEWREAER